MLRFLPLALLALAAVARAQTAVVVFDEDDPDGDGYYAASDGGAVGNATLRLEGPDGRRLPVEAGAAASGADYGVLTYAHGDGGGWELRVGAPGFAPLDLTAADSLVLALDAPAGVPGVSLPRLALEDADGDRSAALPLDFGTRVGFAASRSGFLDGASTDLALGVSYVESLPAELARPGYPEALRITFADTVVTTSEASIGIPGLPARFSVATEAGLALRFRFFDADGDGTLGQDGEAIEVLTEDPATGRLRPTWRVEAQTTPGTAPGEGDVYRLAVFNSGVDGEPGAWQRRALGLSEFGPLGDLDLDRVTAVVLLNPEATTLERTLRIDAVRALAYDGDPEGPPPPTGLEAATGDGTVWLTWTPDPAADGVIVYRQAAPGVPFERITPEVVRRNEFFDLGAQNGQGAWYVLRSVRNAGLGPPLVGPDSAPLEAAAVAGAPDPYIEETARRAFRYFWDEANPANGLVKDRSTPGSASSIAAVGFGLSAITVAVDRGWITRAEAVERTLATLDFFATCPQGPDPSGVCGHRGFFYHFLDMGTGERRGTTELSTVDTALLLGGVLHAARYYDGGGLEADVRARADQIWRRVEWDWAANRPPLVTLGWKPEAGQGGFAICNGGLCDWNGYNEAMIVYVLGLGSPTHPLPDGAWDAWTAGYAGQWQTHYGYSFLTFPPLFGHQYSHVWIDFRNIQDDYMRGRGSTYFENSRLATLAQRAYAIDNPRNYPNYSAREWGITASDVPDGYRARGAPPAQNDDGTLTPTAAGGSYAFTPELSREALRTVYARYYAFLWGDYGLRDAYNVERGWFATDVLGIDQGPIALMIENARTGAIWDAFMTHPDVRTGLERAGFDLAPVAAAPGPAVEAVRLRAPAPNPTAGTVRLGLDVEAPVEARLTVLDALGREVAVVLEGPLGAGAHEAVWDAASAAAGVYVVRLEARDLIRTRTVVVTR